MSRQPVQVAARVVQQITRPQHSPKVNWGGPVTVFRKRGGRELWHIPYHNVLRRPVSTYHPARLVLVENADVYWREGKSPTIDLPNKPRPTAALFRRCAARIDDFFQYGVAELLHHKKCLIVEEI